MTYEAEGQLEVWKIWEAAPHNAFTDLIRFREQWYCVFREGEGHVSDDGKLRVIASPDGVIWTSVALLEDPEADLRDAKISVTPTGRLMLSGAAALHQPAEYWHRSRVWFSEDGRDWTPGYNIADPDYWLWRVTWHGDTAYGIGYRTGPESRGVRLYRSQDGLHWDTLVEELGVAGYPNETALVFLPDGRCLCLLRRDGEPGQTSDFLGAASPPYTEWSWQDLGFHIGGPQMILLPDGRLVAGGRHPGGRTALLWVDAEAGKATEFLTLPSAGDTSYPGLVWHEGRLWVSYYSSQEGKSNIYLARVKLPPA